MNPGRLGLLENVRVSNGPECLKNYFRHLLLSDRGRALEAINSPDTGFGTLYLLKQEFPDEIAGSGMDPVRRKALELAYRLMEDNTPKTASGIRSGGTDTLPVLRWIFQTGMPEDGLGGKYEQLMERTAALLVKCFNDTAALPVLADMIFARNRRGGLIHELVWAFFESCRPESLVLVAQRLLSPDSRDAALAMKLLCFIPIVAKHMSQNGIKDAPGGAGMTGGAGEETANGMTGGMADRSSEDSAHIPGSNAASLYQGVLGWLAENGQFLQYTGESMQLCGMPRFYRVSWEAKYVCRPISPGSGNPASGYSPLEALLISHFKGLPENAREQLADFSYDLYRKNPAMWNSWIRLPVNEQVKSATVVKGGWA